MSYIIQARRPGSAYRTLDTQKTLDAAVWSLRQYDVGFEPWASSVLRIVDCKGKVIVRATPKGGAK